MRFAEQRYLWTWDLEASPEALWPFASDTARFNRDCGLPPFEPVPDLVAEPGVRRLRARYLGFSAEWEEREFEWAEPVRFGVSRTFLSGPLASVIQACSLIRRKEAGTTLTYELRIQPRSLAGAVLARLVAGGRIRRAAEHAFRRYDRQALRSGRAPEPPRAPAVGKAALRRIDSIGVRLVSQAGQPEGLVSRLGAHLANADEISVAKIRPYELADGWGAARRDVLDLFLHATRAGLLDFSWEVLCPHCRGASLGVSSLTGVGSDAHCDSCGIDFKVNFDQSVELTFVPNASVRPVSRVRYCLGGPRVTPHVVAQKRLGAGETFHVAVSYPDGRYRVRARNLPLQYAFRVAREGPASAEVSFGEAKAPDGEPVVGPGGILAVKNAGAAERLAVIERVAWSDQAVTAAEVTSRQLFRDLFSREILRQGEQISVGSMTIVFTDLKHSTRLYGEIGDAPAFGLVLDHFGTLKVAIAAEGGGIVKTMGDAVMAAFTEPAAAVRAMAAAQAHLAKRDSGPALSLKCAIHIGPCLAIAENERLDYFGTTVNVCSRLCSLSSGSDIVVSEELMRDPQVGALVEDARPHFTAASDAAPIRGMGEAPRPFWRLKPAP